MLTVIVTYSILAHNMCISPYKATNCVDIQFYRGCFGFAIMLMYVSEIHQCPEEVKATIKMETLW